MIKWLRAKNWWALFIGLALLGSFLRVWKYWEFPIAGETQDEAAWTMLGSSLLQTGRPASWSYFSGYETLALIERGEDKFRLVQPALDHPPLFSLFPGAAQTAAGGDWQELPSIKLVRFPVVILAIFNLGLFARWIYRVSVDRLSTVGKLAALGIFATAPSNVWLSRLIVSENLIVTAILLLLIAAERWGKLDRWLAAAALLMLPLTKISGLAVSAAAVWSEALLERDRWRWTLFAALGGLALLVLYVSAIDLPLFLTVQAQQAARETGWLTLFSSQLWAPTMIDKVTGDVWETLGFIAAFAWLLVPTKDKNDRRLGYVFLAQLAFILLSVGEHTFHGWYRIVLLPIFAYALGFWIDRVWQNRSSVGLALGWILALPVIRLGLLSWLGSAMYVWQGSGSKIGLLLAGANLLAEPLPAKTREKIWRGLSLLLVLLVLSSNILAVIGWRDQPTGKMNFIWNKGFVLKEAHGKNLGYRRGGFHRIARGGRLRRGRARGRHSR
jgi:hypothetical protein